MGALMVCGDMSALLCSPHRALSHAPGRLGLAYARSWTPAFSHLETHMHIHTHAHTHKPADKYVDQVRALFDPSDPLATPIHGDTFKPVANRQTYRHVSS